MSNHSMLNEYLEEFIDNRREYDDDIHDAIQTYTDNTVSDMKRLECMAIIDACGGSIKCIKNYVNEFGDIDFNEDEYKIYRTLCIFCINQYITENYKDVESDKHEDVESNNDTRIKSYFTRLFKDKNPNTSIRVYPRPYINFLLDYVDDFQHQYKQPNIDNDILRIFCEKAVSKMGYTKMDFIINNNGGFKKCIEELKIDFRFLCKYEIEFPCCVSSGYALSEMNAKNKIAYHFLYKFIIENYEY